MAPRRPLANNAKSYNINYKKLNVSDVVCPICRSILIEPVTLPCNHGFCASCFDNTMENANLVCPLCRIRIGSWLRAARKKKTLLNEEFWRAIKEQFPQQIKNKLNGMEEDLLEDATIVRLAHPGEIRQEYEIERQKEAEIFKKQRDADIKASEALIEKIKQEEEYQQTVMEEKLMLDEQVARKMAEIWNNNTPSTSKASTQKKTGPIDKFLKTSSKSTDNVKSSCKTDGGNKDYTCRILCLDTEKKLPMIQKIIEQEISSDSNDSIESECRYFKPIDYRHNPPSARKSPLRIPTVKATSKSKAQVMSPSGQINFNSNILESAFARISINVAKCTKSELIERNTTTSCTNNDKKQLKRKLSKDEVSNNNKKSRESPQQISNDMSTNIYKSTKTKRKLFSKTSANYVASNISPPFNGFENCAINSKKSNSYKKDIKFSQVVDEETKRLRQEEADLKYALKLQEEFNKSCQYSTRTRSKISKGNTKRQATLDEMLPSSYKVK